MQDQHNLADANDIPWPLPQSPTAEVAVEIGNKLMVALVSRELESILAASKEP